ncbi:MAG: hypothetical protein IIT71_02770 [Acetobacter sp.]|nr:hypothetical protein [Acetobacter sp.]
MMMISIPLMFPLIFGDKSVFRYGKRRHEWQRLSAFVPLRLRLEELKE